MLSKCVMNVWSFVADKVSLVLCVHASFLRWFCDFVAASADTWINILNRSPRDLVPP